MRKIVISAILFLLVFTLFLSSVQASDEEVPEEILYDYELEQEVTNNELDPGLTREPITWDPAIGTGGTGGVEADSIIRTTTYSKENVVKYTQWSGFRRVSDNLSTMYGSPGQIYADRSTTFTTTGSGGYGNLGFSFSKSVTSTIGFSLTVPKDRRVYLGYRVLYNVETGTRVTKTGGVVRSRQTYTYKVPQYGEYKLLNAPY